MYLSGFFRFLFVCCHPFTCCGELSRYCRHPPRAEPSLHGDEQSCCGETTTRSLPFHPDAAACDFTLMSRCASCWNLLEVMFWRRAIKSKIRLHHQNKHEQTKNQTNQHNQPVKLAAVLIKQGRRAVTTPSEVLAYQKCFWSGQVIFFDLFPSWLPLIPFGGGW